MNSSRERRSAQAPRSSETETREFLALIAKYFLYINSWTKSIRHDLLMNNQRAEENVQLALELLEREHESKKIVPEDRLSKPIYCLSEDPNSDLVDVLASMREQPAKEAKQSSFSSIRNTIR